MQDVTVYDASPDQALQAIQAHDGPVLLDLDETLYLSNSTEDFLDLARPGLLALIVMRMLDLVKPWRWTGGDQTRDVWRVRVICLLFPWVLHRWRNKAAEFAERFTNHRLLDAVKAKAIPPIVVTVGFHPIVNPLIVAMDLPDAKIVAARHSNFADRREGKLSLAIEALGEDLVSGALIVTDSPQDLPLMARCKTAVRTLWPDARFRPAFSGVYLPGQYLSRVKRPGERYIIRGILQEDFALWVLGTVALAPMPIMHIVGLLLLLCSFWAIYERGYVDNDLAASRFEESPKLSNAFWESPVATPLLIPWLWAAIFGAFAILLLRWPVPPSLLDFANWAAFLIVTYTGFYLYNRFDKATRVWLYPGLQVARNAAFVVLVPVTVVGALAIAAHVIARWIPYYTYRFGSGGWPQVPTYAMQLMFLLVLFTMLALAQGIVVLLNWSALALLAWTLFRARREIRSIAGHARRIDRFSKR